ncbi:MAG: LysR family transcriptional regulator [Chloroflexus sp.]|jgi:DNA-binding transcriptional LysR family regulator|uniref:LysR substrate-binding n=1 Tax=Chloroflexus aurantiacus (strain ATCC 29366 / DSM 635 / J-10-fl) TaxID=324602 RepID=A9WDF5_CHLAA|nr:MULTISPECIES: LysR family transcriptional regulator [Chloroflexus]RMG46253.1 MAG: LysR family transcriptional regulator [Chloroflexota bacterium]ABY37074.1 LysR substrate-binding [Chloroflexus aurantiacus J-10-fl]GIV86660.1 MAG: LysR family transcriptional regulator [Chloroflexus sp.]GIV93141.1 MAG: LysR family transcriptional regulator [Chloroflexus sp.]HBW66920.1 LysR family transcriptional regulator [Chloroflexus aurantiacus]
MLDLYKLDIFTRVVAAGSLSKAAEQLHMTQSGVSQHIRALEDSLGTELFVRGRRGVELTPAGQRLLAYCEGIFRLVAEAELAVTDVAGLRDGQLTIGVTPGVSAYLLPEWVQMFRQRYPNLAVSAQTGTTPSIVNELRNGSLDLGAIEGELDSAERDLQQQALREFDQYVVVGRRHPWWGRSEVHLQELAGQPMVMRQSSSQTRVWLDHALREQSLTPRIIAELDNLESIKRMVMIGTGLTILPLYAVTAEQEVGALHPIPIAGRPLRRTLRLLWRATRPLSPVAYAFRQLLIAHYGH